MRPVPIAALPRACRPTIQAYLRRTLVIHKSIKQIGIKLSLVLDGEIRIFTTARDESTLGSFLAVLEELKEEVLAAKKFEISGDILSLNGPKKIQKASRPRGGKQLNDETDYKALMAALFGENPGHMAEGAWTAAASDVMRRQPSYLTRFDADRELVEKVLGDTRYYNKPCTFVCPFKSAVCHKGVHRLAPR